MKSAKPVFILLVCLLFVSTGCNGKSEPVGDLAGVVTVDGEPLGDCSVVLFNQEKQFSITARVDSQGNYSIKDILTGVYKVAVRQQPQNFPTGEDFEHSIEVLDQIPVRYRTLEQSDLSFELAEGDNEFNVVL